MEMGEGELGGVRTTQVAARLSSAYSISGACVVSGFREANSGIFT